MKMDFNSLTKLGKHHLGYILSTIFEKTPRIGALSFLCWVMMTVEGKGVTLLTKDK